MAVTSIENYIEEIQEKIKGEFLADPLSLSIYGSDASIFHVTPKVVVWPKCREDLIQSSKIAKKYKLSITPRGAGTGIAGGCIGEGIILDTSRHLNRILEIDIKNQHVTCEPGVIQDHLNEALKPHGYRLGPDTSTGNRATVGGMVGNNSAGARSLFYDRTSESVVSVEVVLSSGQVVTLKNCHTREELEQLSKGDPLYKILKMAYQIKDEEAETIKEHFPKIKRRASGYNLDELSRDEDTINLAALFTGSEGTFGLISKVTFKIVPLIKHTRLKLFFFDDFNKAFKSVPELLKYKPYSLEMVDHRVIQPGRSSPMFKNKLKWLKGSPKAIVSFEVSSNEINEIDGVLEEIEGLPLSESYSHILTTSEEQKEFWDLRKSGLGLLLSKRQSKKAIAFIEDLTVDPTQLPSFFESFSSLLKKHGKEAGIYGHVGAGCIHIRPYMDISKQEELDLMFEILEETSELVKQHAGVLSGEHGDGLIRSWLYPKFFHADINRLFERLKDCFDPYNTMNPGKLIHTSHPRGVVRHAPNLKEFNPKTYFTHEDQEGFNFEINMCNGNGQCRKMDGLMCPSFQVTRDERHSTRGRANALQGILNGRLSNKLWVTSELLEVMDLCLECKGCLKECPSQVDIAKVKSELLYQYHKKHGISLRSRFFASLPELDRIASIFPALSNTLMRSFPFRYLMDKFGITKEREFPKITQPFSKNYVNRTPFHEADILFFSDTYCEFHENKIMDDALYLFKKLGFKPYLLSYGCCGRPAYSKGFLPKAKKLTAEIIEKLTIHGDQRPIVVFEPSCRSMLSNDLLSMHRSEEAQALTQRVVSPEFLLADYFEKYTPVIHSKEKITVAIHGHCHEKALEPQDTLIRIFNQIPECELKILETGCCGLAGSFGYEKEHHEISEKIARLSIIPKVKELKSEDRLIANGTSCRSQLKHFKIKEATHIISFLRELMS